MRLSGLQREILSLYRICLRECRKKEKRSKFESYVRIEFEKNHDMDKKDFQAIEFLLRKGQRKLNTYKDPAIKDITISK
ncbi:hypothetical protein K3495_g4801 [Podosphaera aphanis]|nr:hypothetical protein K3495_g4801 [Podosphaera aphanis]